QFNTVALVGRSNTPGIAEPLATLADSIATLGFEVVFEGDTAREIGIAGYPALTPAEIGARADVAIVLGGDGTHRAVAAHCGATPLVALSTGTNNAFPEHREATVAGVAAGLAATGAVPAEVAFVRNKRLVVRCVAGA
ncbi:NAD(+)/NADH kinase, partial [Bacillus subtilis]|nr:NAD(+)/NADH kinase [Bacillus subtilis]